MATLTANINSTQTVIPVSGTAPETGSYFTAGSEAIRFLGTSRGPGGRSFLRSYWSVDRGIAGTTAASHLSGVTLTQYYPESDGGGSGLPEQWSATEAGQVTATADDISEAVLTIDAPPGSEATGDLVVWVRGEQAENTLFSLDPYGQIIVGGAVVDPTNGGGSVTIKNGAGSVMFRLQANDGSGGQGNPKAGFFGAAAVTRPEVPATPTAQDIVDALVALGLVTQAP